MTYSRAYTPAATNEADLFALLRDAARAGGQCPTNAQLAAKMGYLSTGSIVTLLHGLERRGLIRIRRYQSARQIIIVATGEATVAPVNKTPHWRDRTSLQPGRTAPAAAPAPAGE